VDRGGRCSEEMTGWSAAGGGGGGWRSNGWRGIVFCQTKAMRKSNNLAIFKILVSMVD